MFTRRLSMSSTRTSLLSGAALHSTMSAAERRMGRLMRSPDGHPDGGTPVAFNFPDEVDDINTVPERSRPLYVKDAATGKFKYDDISSLRSALEHEKTQRRSATAKAAAVSKWEALGKTPEEIQTLLDASASAEEKRQRDEGDFDSMKKQLEANHNAQTETYQSKIDKLTRQIEKLMISDQVRSVLADKDVEGNPTLLMAPIRDRVKIEEDAETGDFRLVVKNTEGHPMLNSSNQPATLKDLVAQFKADEDYAGAFKGVNQSGGGTPSRQGGGAPINGKTRGQMSVREKTNFIREHGQSEYEKLPA